MPRGDAARIHRHCRELVARARQAGKTTVTIEVSAVRENLGLRHSDAALDICQVLETEKFQKEAAATALGKKGPRQGVSTVYRFSI